MKILQAMVSPLLSSTSGRSSEQEVTSMKDAIIGILRDVSCSGICDLWADRMSRMGSLQYAQPVLVASAFKEVA